MLEFNFYNSIQYWLVLGAVVLIFNFAIRNLNLRIYGIMIVNILMLLALPNFDKHSLLILLFLSFFTFAIGWILNKKNLTRNKAARITISIVGISMVTLALINFKYKFGLSIILPGSQDVPDWPSGGTMFIGISYFSFKMMHFIFESYKKNIENPNLVLFLNYILFFPSYISGPINRYNHFVQSVNSEVSSKTSKNLKLGAERIVHGLFKKIVVAQILFPYILTSSSKSVEEFSIMNIIIGLYAYSLYFYVDFSAYTDLALGSGRLLGVELPENFNSPFLKKNIQRLWANWHISLTSWLIDYIYWPLAKKLRNIHAFRRRPVFLSNICIIITFVVCGIWHGKGLNFILWGLYHGIGLSILNVYKSLKRKIKNQRIRAYFESNLSYGIGVFLTFSFFSFGLLLFVLDVPTIMNLLNHLLSK